ncbi:MAG: tRNA (N6-threonylcarbamoyladenosine(37)-N6)-methyltransferase TrmO [Thiothrix nivea]|nr:MAG: tRNA (N6-threonylcarbamoyladenosine(37)-N6)-methyltransferase TrmO [Thiothrix nivea]
MSDSEVSLQPIASIRSCYREKFGIPRQPGLVTAARGEVRLLPEFSQPDIVRGLEPFSHLWLIFYFHATADAGWKPTVRPPRLGGNQRLGVFATRSMFRPNALGLSVVKLEGIAHETGGIVLQVSGLDLLDGTPVLDIKPYLPYADALEATGGFAAVAPAAERTVVFSPLAEEQCRLHAVRQKTDIRLLIEQILQQDPRPSYRLSQQDDHQYAMQLYDFDVRWCDRGDRIEVLELADLGH